MKFYCACCDAVELKNGQDRRCSDPVRGSLGCRSESLSGTKLEQKQPHPAGCGFKSRIPSPSSLFLVLRVLQLELEAKGISIKALPPERGGS